MGSNKVLWRAAVCRSMSFTQGKYQVLVESSSDPSSTTTGTAGAWISAKSLKFSENYIMSPALTWVLCGAYSALAGLLLAPASAVRAQTTILPSAQQTSEFQEASALYRDGQYERALERLNVWLKSRPKDARGRFLRGMIFAQQKKLDDAARIYTDLT